MFPRMLSASIVLALLVSLPMSSSWGRGFGGGGGARAGGGGFGGADRGGQGGGSFGAAPSRSQLNSFMGLPSDEGMHHMGSPTGNASGAQGAAAASAYSNRNSPQYSGAQGAAASSAYSNRNSPQYSGAQGAAAGAAYGNRNSPQYSGAQGAAAGAAYSNRNSPQYSGAQGAAVGYSAANSGGYAGGFGAVAPSARYASATSVRGNFNSYDTYGASWYTAHPTAWHAATLPAGGAWAAASWNSLGSWFGGGATQPVSYDYGNNVTYQDNSVYVNGQPAGTSDEYYQQAAAIASAGTADAAPADGDWLPLGVFSMSRSDHPSSNLVIQLSVNKQGVIRGNYTDMTTKQTQAVHGGVDQATQRVAFTVGENHESTVIETGLYNLTKDEAPALMHIGKNRTEQWLLVRMKQPSQ